MPIDTINKAPAPYFSEGANQISYLGSNFAAQFSEGIADTSIADTSLTSTSLNLASSPTVEWIATGKEMYTPDLLSAFSPTIFTLDEVAANQDQCVQDDKANVFFVSDDTGLIRPVAYIWYKEGWLVVSPPGTEIWAGGCRVYYKSNVQLNNVQIN